MKSVRELFRTRPPLRPWGWREAVAGWTRRRKAVAALVAVLVAVGVALAVVLVPSPGDGLDDGDAFRVGERTITEAALERRIDTLVALYRLREPEQGPERANFRREAAKSMALSMVLDEEADAAGVSVSDDDARAGLAKVVEERLGGDRSNLDEFMAEVGVSEKDVLDEIRRTLETSRLYEQVTSDVPVPSDAEVRAEFVANADRMRTPEQRALSNIVVDTEAGAREVLQRLRAGESFAALAREVSLDATSRDVGGRLGRRVADELERPYAEAAFAARPGSPFGPLQLGDGWNVGVVTEVVEARALRLAETRETLRASLRSRKQLEVWTAWMAEAIARSGVVYADEYRPPSPDTPPRIGPPVDDAAPVD
ncbi:MAG: peptidylprolyl isomerase [Propionibacteriales bacterium]|nr:peptidylprolyl isomerase [Propionibacteriales bacterium]